MKEFKIFGVSGSLRAESTNSLLLAEVKRLAAPTMEVEIFRHMGDLPLYNLDIDGDRPPQLATALQRKIAQADGVLICSPEYNFGIPGGLKNLIDWASRPSSKTSPLLHKPVAFITSSNGRSGGVRCQVSLRQAFLCTDSDVVGRPEVLLNFIHDRLDSEGKIIDKETERVILSLLETFRQKIEVHRSVQSFRATQADLGNIQ